MITVKWHRNQPLLMLQRSLDIVRVGLLLFVYSTVNHRLGAVEHTVEVDIEFQGLMPCSFTYHVGFTKKNSKENFIGSRKVKALPPVVDTFFHFVPTAQMSHWFFSKLLRYYFFPSDTPLFCQAYGPFGKLEIDSEHVA